jgi:4'-phosphopantetheinyl transferase
MTSCPQAGERTVFTGGAVEVIAAPLDAAPEAAAELSALLSEEERARAARFRFERDRARYIVARARLRQLLGARLGASPAAIELACGRNGKPALARRFARSGWTFNLSHSEGFAAFAFARGREVGVDLEAIRPLEEADEIAARVFSRREHADYRAAPALDKPLAFFRCWTRKEAFAKALGTGLRLRLERFDLSLLGARSAWRLESFSPLPGFVAAVASCPR